MLEFLPDVNFIFLCRNQFSDLGFGVVFDGDDDSFALSDISTQAVMAMMKNVSPEAFDNGNFSVEIAESDVENFNIGRNLQAQNSNYGMNV